MADQQAKVTSVDAIEQFRATLVLFLSKARPTLEEIISDVTRTKQWLQQDQRSHWEKQMKLRSRELENAQAELFSARLSLIQEASAVQQMAVHRAQRAIREAEEKLRVLKRWERELENRSDPMVKEIEQLHGYLTTDMSRAVSYLNEIIKALQSYSERGPVASSAAPPVTTVPDADTGKPPSSS